MTVWGTPQGTWVLCPGLPAQSLLLLAAYFLASGDSGMIWAEALCHTLLQATGPPGEPSTLSLRNLCVGSVVYFWMGLPRLCGLGCSNIPSVFVGARWHVALTLDLCLRSFGLRK